MTCKIHTSCLVNHAPGVRCTWSDDAVCTCPKTLPVAPSPEILHDLYGDEPFDTPIRMSDLAPSPSCGFHDQDGLDVCDNLPTCPDAPSPEVPQSLKDFDKIIDKAIDKAYESMRKPSPEVAKRKLLVEVCSTIFITQPDGSEKRDTIHVQPCTCAPEVPTNEHHVKCPAGGEHDMLHADCIKCQSVVSDYGREARVNAKPEVPTERFMACIHNADDTNTCAVCKPPVAQEEKRLSDMKDEEMLAICNKAAEAANTIQKGIMDKAVAQGLPQEEWWEEYNICLCEAQDLYGVSEHVVPSLLAAQDARTAETTKRAFLDKIAEWEKVGGARDEIGALKGMMEVLGLADFT